MEKIFRIQQKDFLEKMNELIILKQKENNTSFQFFCDVDKILVYGNDIYKTLFDLNLLNEEYRGEIEYGSKRIYPYIKEIFNLKNNDEILEFFRQKNYYYVIFKTKEEQ